MKIQYLVNWSFTYQCRISSFTRALSLPSSSASLSCAVATYSAEAPPRMHQNSPFSYKKFLGRGYGSLPRPFRQWGGGHPLPYIHPLRRLDSALFAPTALGPPNFKTVVAPLLMWEKVLSADCVRKRKWHLQRFFNFIKIDVSQHLIAANCVFNLFTSV